jgi:hypothetical protein
MVLNINVLSRVTWQLWNPLKPSFIPRKDWILSSQQTKHLSVEIFVLKFNINFYSSLSIHLKVRLKFSTKIFLLLFCNLFKKVLYEFKYFSVCLYFYTFIYLFIYNTSCTLRALLRLQFNLNETRYFVLKSFWIYNAFCFFFSGGHE